MRKEFKNPPHTEIHFCLQAVLAVTSLQGYMY